MDGNTQRILITKQLTIFTAPWDLGRYAGIDNKSSCGGALVDVDIWIPACTRIVLNAPTATAQSVDVQW
jgi:hypothetical protein